MSGTEFLTDDVDQRHDRRGPKTGSEDGDRVSDDADDHRSTVVKAAVLAAVIVAGVVAWLVFGVPDLGQVQSAIDRAGPWAPILFVVAYAVITLTPIPKSVLSIAAGAVFGAVLGSALVYLGALLGAGAAFRLGRVLGRDAVERFTGAKVDRLDTALEKRGLATMIGIRLIPILPFTLINYGAGLSSVGRRDYALGTAIGILPGTVAYVALGSGIASGQKTGVIIAAAALVLLSVVTIAWRVRQRRHAGL